MHVDSTEIDKASDEKLLVTTDGLVRKKTRISRTLGDGMVDSQFREAGRLDSMKCYVVIFGSNHFNNRFRLIHWQTNGCT